MRHAVSWTRTIEHTAVVEVTLDELVTWAAAASAARALAVGGVRSATADELRSSIDRNPHLRARLLQLYAEQNAATKSTTTRSAQPVVDPPPSD